MTVGAHTGERFVVLALAAPRAAWFTAVGHWATAASLPIDLVRCLSPDELHARLTAGRPYSGALVDGSLPAVDRDLMEVANRARCPVIVVDRRDEPWMGMGAAAVLAPDLDREALAAALARHAVRIGSLADLEDPMVDDSTSGWRGRVVAVCGGGGTGTSTIASALAQGTGADLRWHRRVLLADLALHADQALRHQATDVVPSVSELVDAFRMGTLDEAAILGCTVRGERHPYRLLLGLRRHRDWTALRPRALVSAVDALRRCFALVVTDVEADIEGEEDTGSADVEERNALARVAISTADLVIVTFRTDDAGVHRLVRIVESLVAQGTETARVLPLANRAPRSPARRADVARAVSSGAAACIPDAPALLPTVFVGEVRSVERAQRDGAVLPAPIVAAVTGPTSVALDRLPGRRHGVSDPVPVRPGHLGTFAEEA